MKLTMVTNCKAVMFDNVDQGSIILYNENLYMRIPCVTQTDAENKHTNNVNAVNLETGALRFIPSNMLILLVEDYEFKYLV